MQEDLITYYLLGTNKPPTYVRFWIQVDFTQFSVAASSLGTTSIAVNLTDTDLTALTLSGITWSLFETEDKCIIENCIKEYFNVCCPNLLSA